MTRILDVCLLLAVVFSLSPVAAGADQPPDGAVVLAKTTPDALLVWDATPVLAGLVRAHSPASQELAKLEAYAMQIAIRRSPALPASKAIEVRVIYQKTGDVNPAYRTATFAGIERLLVVSALRSDVLQNGEAYADQLGRGTIPAGVAVSIVGKLPPPQ